MLDLDPYTGRELDVEFKTLLQELRQYSADVGALPMCVALTKADIWQDILNEAGDSPDKKIEALKAIPELQEKGIVSLFEAIDAENLLKKTCLISSASSYGLEDLKNMISLELIGLGPREYKNHVSSVVSYGNAELFGDEDEDDGFVFDDNTEFDADGNDEVLSEEEEF